MEEEDLDLAFLVVAVGVAVFEEAGLFLEGIFLEFRVKD